MTPLIKGEVLVTAVAGTSYLIHRAHRRLRRRDMAVREGIAYLCHLSIERTDDNGDEATLVTPDDLLTAFDPSRASERRGYLRRQVSPPAPEVPRERGFTRPVVVTT